MVRMESRLPRRAPELSPGKCPQGRGRKPRVARGPRKALLATPGESEEHRKQAATGRLFFGYFLLAEQKKVSRLRVREPDSSNRRASDSLTNKEML
jgi:hypothetical protein